MTHAISRDYINLVRHYDSYPWLVLKVCDNSNNIYSFPRFVLYYWFIDLGPENFMSLSLYLGLLRCECSRHLMRYEFKHQSEATLTYQWFSHGTMYGLSHWILCRSYFIRGFTRSKMKKKKFCSASAVAYYHSQKLGCQMQEFFFQIRWYVLEINALKKEQTLQVYYIVIDRVKNDARLYRWSRSRLYYLHTLPSVERQSHFSYLSNSILS